MSNSSRERRISRKPEFVPLETIEQYIVVLRGQKVMLDEDLAALYGVGTKALNQAIKRNAARFPDDFIFRLSAEEASAIRSRFVTASRRNARYLPFAFTEHGAIMAATVLNSPEIKAWAPKVLGGEQKGLSRYDTSRNIICTGDFRKAKSMSVQISYGI